MKNYYKVLGVSKSVDDEALLKAYLKLVKKYREKSSESLIHRNNLILITEAFNTLSNQSKRTAYDRKLQYYLDNKERLDKEKIENRLRKKEEKKRKEEEEAKRKEEEAKRKEEEEAKRKEEEEEAKRQEEEKAKKKEEEAKKKEEEEAKKKEEEEAKKKEEEEAKNQEKEEKANKKEKESDEKNIKESKKESDKSLRTFDVKNTLKFLKSSNVIFLLYGIILTIIIVFLITKCDSENDFKDLNTTKKSEEINSNKESTLNNQESTLNNQEIKEEINNGEETNQYENLVEATPKPKPSNQPEETKPNYPRRGVSAGSACDGTTLTRKFHDGRGGFYYQDFENSKECGYVEKTQYELRGKIFKSECIGTDLVGTYHDGKGGFYTEVINKNSTDCGYKKEEALKDWKLEIRVYNGKNKPLKINDNVYIYILKNLNISASIIDSFNSARLYDKFGDNIWNGGINLSNYPGAKYILIKGSSKKGDCDYLVEIENKKMIPYTCENF